MRANSISTENNDTNVLSYEDGLVVAISQAKSEAKEAVKTGKKKGGKNKVISKFPISSFPDKVREIIEAVQDNYGLPLDHYASGVLSAFSTVLGNKVVARYKLKQEYVLSQYSIVVGPPSTGKTPSIEFGLEPLLKFEAEMQKQNDQAKSDYNIQRKRFLDEKGSEEPKMPITRELILNELTVEGVTKSLAHNPHGLLVYQDELVSWIREMTDNSKRNRTPFWLKLWGGKFHKVNRATATSNRYLTHTFLNVIGGVQPGVIGEMAKDGNRENGFLARLLFFYPDSFMCQEENDKEPDPQIYHDYEDIVRFLWNMPSKIVEPEHIEQHGQIERIPILLEDGKARKIYINFLNQYTREINANMGDDDILGILGKLKQYCLRFACTLEFMQYACKHYKSHNKEGVNFSDWDWMRPGDIMNEIKISEQSVLRAIKLTEYFKSTHLKVLSRLDNTEMKLEGFRHIWYKNCPADGIKEKDAIVIANAITKVAGSCGLSESSVKRMLKNQSLFYKNKLDRMYHKKD